MRVFLRLLAAAHALSAQGTVVGWGPEETQQKPNDNETMPTHRASETAPRRRRLLIYGTQFAGFLPAFRAMAGAPGAVQVTVDALAAGSATITAVDPSTGKNSDKANARIESDNALQRVIVGLMKDDTELFKQFMDNQEFRRWLSETVFDMTYDAA